MRYYGCKTKLLDYIEDVLTSLRLKKGAIIFDIFSGTSTVGSHFKKLGYTILANDFLEFAFALAYCYIKINNVPKFHHLRNHLKRNLDANGVIEYLNQLPGKADFITINYSPYRKNKRRYLSIKNAKKIDVIRKKMHLWKLKEWINEAEYYYLIASLINAINLVSNVTGTYAAYLKNWDARALKTIKLTPPKIIKSKMKNLAMKANANNIISKFNVDVLYLDPPYNTRQFASNYFLLELIAEGWFDKKPKIYGQTGMRSYDGQKSDYCKKDKAMDALLDLITKAKTKYIILSYNNEGIIPLKKIREALMTRGEIREFIKTHKRYRAINQDGSNVKTKELLFLLKVTK